MTHAASGDSRGVAPFPSSPAPPPRPPVIPWSKDQCDGGWGGGVTACFGTSFSSNYVDKHIKSTKIKNSLLPYKINISVG